MFKDISLAIVIVILAFIGLLVVLYPIKYMVCTTEWKDSGYNYKIPFVGSCLIEIKNDKWVPARNLRQFD